MSAIIPIAVPKWGIEMVEGTVNCWLKQAGDAIRKGEELLEIESDKIVNVWEAPVDGVLRRCLVAAGEARPVGSLLGIIASADVDDAVIDDYIAHFGIATRSGDATAPAAESFASPASESPSNPESDVNRRTNPVVRRLAEELGVDLEAVSGTGRNGRITQEDVRAAAQQRDASEETRGAGAAPYEVIPLSTTRKTIARRLTKAKQDIPHYYLGVEWPLDGLLAHRARLNRTGDTKVSVNDLLVYCVGRALMKVPRVNVNVVGDTIHQFTTANVAVAVATDEALYPVTLRHVETLSAAEIATAISAAAERARSGTLTTADLSDASFTVSNLGMFGIDRFTAIINPPMGAILALGAARERVVADKGEIKVATVMDATLSCDHRAIDGALGAAFLAALRTEIDSLGA